MVHGRALGWQACAAHSRGGKLDARPARDGGSRMSLPTGTPTQQFIAGEWRDGSKGSFDVLNPATGEPICQVPRAGADDVAAAIDAAAQALPGWSATAPRERAEVLRRTFELMIERKEELAYLMSL